MTQQKGVTEQQDSECGGVLEILNQFILLIFLFVHMRESSIWKTFCD